MTRRFLNRAQGVVAARVCDATDLRRLATDGGLEIKVALRLADGTVREAGRYDPPHWHLAENLRRAGVDPAGSIPGFTACSAALAALPANIREMLARAESAPTGRYGEKLNMDEIRLLAGLKEALR